MGLHRHRHLRRLGLPEFLFVVAIVATVATSILLWQSLQGSNHIETQGRVVTGRLVPTHYNAPPDETKVIMTYEYMVGGSTYIAAYEGFWPEGGGPNALMPDELDKLTREGHPLTVLYRPEDPAASWLHADIPGGKFPRAAAFALALACTLLYCFWAYPAWRGR